MRAYKYLSSRYVESLLGGTFRFGRSEFYRFLEIATGDADIGDRNEAAAASLVVKAGFDSRVDSKSQIEEERTFLREELRIVVPGDAVIKVSNHRVMKAIDCFILSLSSSAVGDLRTQASVASSADEYDACVRIEDVEALRTLLYTSGTVVGTSTEWDGKPVSEVFGGINAGPVGYADVQEEVSGRVLNSPDPFRKSTRYSNQMEVRIVLGGFQRAPAVDAIYVECKKASGLLHLEFCNPSADQVYDERTDIMHLRALLYSMAVYCRTFNREVIWQSLPTLSQRSPLPNSFEQMKLDVNAEVLCGEALFDDCLWSLCRKSYWALRTNFGKMNEIDCLLDQSAQNMNVAFGVYFPSYAERVRTQIGI